MTEETTDPSTTWSLPTRRPLPDMIAERLVRAIRSGELEAGQRVVELTLAKKLGVSRGPLREALRLLEANGLVESRNGYGSYVAKIGPDDLSAMLAVRAVIEGLAAKLVAERRTPATIALLSKIHKDLHNAAASGDHVGWRELSWRFHETVCLLAENKFLLRAWRSINSLVGLFLLSHPDFEADKAAVLRNHDDALLALRDASPDMAESMFRAIIARSAAKARQASTADTPKPAGARKPHQKKKRT